jgi:hypothetical protein
MRTRNPFVTVCGLAALLAFCGKANATDRFWQGDVSSIYGGTTGNAGNWNTLGGTGTPTSPRASSGERAVIGTDDPAGAVNCLNAPFGCPVISANVAAPGGIAMGVRVIDVDDLNENSSTTDFLYDNFDPENPTTVVPPFFNMSTLVGKLTITGGSVSPVTTTSPGADGRVLVGVNGRGYLTMTGGTLTLNNTALVVGGLNATTDAGTPQELGPSTVDLSGNATVNLMGGTGAIANFDRRLKVSGPNVVFNSTGRVRFVGTSLYTADITSATSHSILNTQNNALLAGSLAVNFSGAGATRDPITSLGTKWTLIKSTLGDNAIDGNFSNLGPGGVITPTGLDAAHAAPLGANYRVKKVAVGSTSELQLSYEQTLVLTVNRDNGQVSIRNPLTGQIAIDSYSITSARGSLLASYAGLGASTPGAGPWVKPGPPGANTSNALTEVQDPTTNPAPYNLASIPSLSVSIGTGFSRTAVGANIANYGLDGEDLIFEFAGPGTGGVLRGQVEYVGTKFENDLVLRVNPNTGQAFIKNDSLVTLKFDGYSILSSTGNLNGAGFTGLGGTWQTSSPPTANAISQSNLTNVTTLAPGAQQAIGDISSLNFTTAEAQAGLSIQYILAEGLTGTSAVGGDYNSNGVVDAADYTIWRNAFNTAVMLPNQNPAAVTPNLVDQEDYNFWKTQFGQSATPGAETTFRIGSVVFDAAAGSGSGTLAGAAVPEPSTACLMLALVGFVASYQRRRSLEQSSHEAAIQQRGVSTMKLHTKFTWIAVLLGFFAVCFQSPFAQAATQGIALTNSDFELPGPAGTKTVAFNETGTPFAPSAPIVTLNTGERAGGTPGWTFTGGSGIAASGETNVGVGNSTFGGNSPGDSGTEGGGNPGNELILSTLDGRVYQSSAFNVVSIPATQKYKLSFDAHDIFSPSATCHLQARLYYVDASSNRQTIGSPLLINNLTGFAKHTIEFVGGDAALNPAMGRPIGVEFDTVSRENDPAVTESWAGIDNVILQVTGTIFGDLNGDGFVNTTDYTTLRDNLQEAHTFEFQGELTGDYKVDLNDFRAFKTAYDMHNGAGSFDIMLSGLNVPEPTSLGLLATLTSLLGIFWRRRCGTGRVCGLIVSAVVFGGAYSGATRCEAVQFAYDPFLIGANPAAGEYIETTFVGDPAVATDPLEGQNPTIGPANPSFFRDAWTLGGAGQAVLGTGLAYRGTPSPGGSINGFGRTERYLNNTGNPNAVWDDTTTGTYYMSFVVNFGQIAPGGNMGYRALEFFPVGVVPGENRIGDIGYNEYDGRGGAVQQNAATAKMTFNLYGYQIIDTAPDSYIEDGSNHLLVLKWAFTTDVNGDSISLYLDPPSLDEPVIPSAVVTGINAQLGAIGAASFGSAIAGTTTQMDDIRVGDTFADVMPALPKPGDTNGDDIIDLADYNNIIQHMNLSGAAVPSLPELHPDVTGDGRVTIADYRLWKDKREVFGAGSIATAGIPEPSSFLLLVVATAAGLFVRRR